MKTSTNDSVFWLKDSITSITSITMDILRFWHYIFEGKNIQYFALISQFIIDEKIHAFSQ